VAASTAPTRWITVGVDTHKDRHVAAAVDQSGRVLASTQAPTTVNGCKQLLAWAQAHGRVDRFGIEGTGAYGAGLARFLRAAGHQVVEVDRPNRQTRRRQGKSDPSTPKPPRVPPWPAPRQAAPRPAMVLWRPSGR
jgi:transposase